MGKKPRPKKEKMRLKREKMLAAAHFPAITETIMADRFLNKDARVYPIPEILEDGRGWRIRQDKNRVGVDYDEKMIFVPLDDHPISHNVKLQQIARIKWDDRAIPNEDMLLFKAVDDHRLSYLLNGAGLDLEAGFLTEQHAGLLLSYGRSGTLAMLLMTDYTGKALSPDFLFENAREPMISLFIEARKRIRDDPTKANVVKVVQWLRQYVDDAPQPAWMSMKGCMKADGKAFKHTGSGGIKCQMSLEDFFEWAWDECEEDLKIHDIPSEVRDELPDELPAAVKAMMETYLQNHRGTSPEHTVNFQPWGIPRLEEPPRPLAATGKFMRKWKATDEGVFPRYPHRYAVDQRVFSRRIKMPGGTVIIDSSGSMGLTPAAIKAMVEAAPGCVVANYSGNGAEGVIRILAKGGKRVLDQLCCPPSGGMNVIDYHGLRWAYKQSHPRIWVSDLGVTGICDQSGPGNLAMCAAVVQKGRFFHGRNVDEAIKIFKRLGRFYKEYSSMNNGKEQPHG
jgi:hypothetical protein